MFTDFIELTWNDVPYFAKAAITTLQVTLTSLFLGTLLGTIVGIIKTSKYTLLNRAMHIYIEPLRNSPVVTQLFLVYYGLPMVSAFVPSAYSAAILTLTLNTGAFVAVIVHSSITAIPRSQWDQAYALGMNKFEAFRYVIFHQALRLAVPPAITLYIAQLQVSAIVALIGLVDLTRAGRVVTLRTFKPFLVWGIVAAIYFAISFPLSKLARRLENRIKFSW